MRYSYSVSAGITGFVLPAPAISVVLKQIPGRRAEADRRWPALLSKLTSLRKRGCLSVRIVDASCGAGELLLQAVRRAKSLGFVAIEGRGIDRDPALIARARATARTVTDLAIGVEFAVGEPCEALGHEADFPADIVLYAAQDGDDALDKAARTAGNTVLGARSTDRRDVA